MRVHEYQTCKRYFHRDTGSAQLMARIVWSRTRSDDEANPVPLRRWQPPTALYKPERREKKRLVILIREMKLYNKLQPQTDKDLAKTRQCHLRH